MRTFTVVIKATVVKTIEVEARDEDEAVSLAHTVFTVTCDGDERYTEDTLDVEDVTEYRRKVA